jgi:RNA polymerase sigma-70 factor (TIGR02943 family)
MSPEPASGPGARLSPETWVATYGDYLFSFCMFRVNNRETAEDLVQDTFVSAIRAKDAFLGQASEKTWLTAILKNKILDHYRRNDVLKNASDYLDETEREFSSHFFDRGNGHWHREAAPAAWSEMADRNLHRAEFDAVVRMCISKMPSRLAPVFVAKFIDEEETEIICKAHGLSASNYWVIVHRAKVLMRSCLEKNWFMAKR